ncbi:Poly A polymerase [Macleaya cordata]|uniref:Poly A polymerase n=1 Tax=Macleaya cordata TaxID=56857 RepID=A0A200R3U1_MACCD|nr:Poly A polymerase [Macleaya cordata]
MAIPGLGFGCRSHFPLRCPPYMYCVRKVRPWSPCSVTALETLSEPEGFFNEESHEFTYSHKTANDDVKALKWKKLSAKELGITTSMISRPTRVVLNELNRKGYEVYLVGGCVRDLILKQTPKDFDIITSAELKQVLRTFSRCNIVGRRFPICHVHVNDTIVEVSSFSTSGRKSRMDSRNFTRPRGCNEHDYLRWRNCMGRDFTINGLMFDPYANVVYDYMGGMEDIKKAKVRTMIPPDTSFQEDCARILRAVRIAARLGFRFTKDTALSVKNLRCLVLRLDKGRLLMEMNYMLAYGSAEASLRLLWRFGLLEILLPIQAAYFVSQGFRRRDKRSNMLLSLFANLDGCLAPDKPCHCSLWVAMLVFHKALVDCPKDHMVVATFSLAVHLGGDLLQAVRIARAISRPHDRSLCELLEPQELDSDETLMDEVMDLAASVNAALKMMTNESSVAQAMAKYPTAPYSDLVLIPLQQYVRVLRIFDCVRGGKEKEFTPKRGTKIDYEYLAMGKLQEVRHIFARVVFDTIYPPELNQRRAL